MSHGTHADHAAAAETVRAVQAELGRPLALIADLQGPKLRIGSLPEVRRLQTGEQVVVTGDTLARNGELPIAPAVVSDVLRPGHDVLIDDGLVRLRVDELEHGRALCTVVVGGQVRSNKGVNLPGAPIPIPCLTEKDLIDLELALQLEVDYLALSFVRAAADVRELQELIRRSGSGARVI